MPPTRPANRPPRPTRQEIARRLLAAAKAEPPSPGRDATIQRLSRIVNPQGRTR